MSALGRRLAATLAVAGVVLTFATGIGPASAPADAAQPIATNAQIKIIVSQLTPTVIKPKSMITVSGTLTNTTHQTLAKPSVRLQAGPALTSRSELQAADTIPPTSDAATCDFGKPLADLAPAVTVSFTTRCSAKTLGLTTQLGVYPVLVNVNAIQADGTHARVGQANTFLPYFPQRPHAPTQVSWIWPIIDHPHRMSSGVFHDDLLSKSLAASGRLGRAVQIALDAPTKVALTVAIDPAVVADAVGMTDPHGYRVQQGTSTVRGRGGPIATDWLTRLRTLVHRPNVTVVAVPYADPDLVALTRAGLTSELSTGYVQGTTILTNDLGIRDTAPIAYPPAGELDDATLYALAGLRLSAAVLSPDALPAVDTVNPTPDAIAALPAQGASMLGLVTDPSLSALINRPVPVDGHRLADQRFLAELAMITAEAPNTPRHVLIAPPRRWNPSPISSAMLADTAGVPWSTSSSAQDLLAAPTATRRGALTYPAAAGHAELSPDATARIAHAARLIDGFRSTVNNRDADTLLTPYYEAVLRAGSSAWRGNPDQQEPYLDDLVFSVGQLRRQVHLVVPATSTYSLASSSSPLVLTVANTLPVTVGVRISVTARGTSGFHTDPMDVQSIAPRSRRTIKVPAHVERSGEFTVIAAITTPAGQKLGQPVELRLRSTAYGVVALSITGGALALLLFMVALRLIRRIRRRPRDPSPPDPADRPMQPTAS